MSHFANIKLGIRPRSTEQLVSFIEQKLAQPHLDAIILE